MFDLLLKIFLKLITKCITERLLSKCIVYTLDFISKKTSNKLDDKIVASVAEALGIKIK